MIDIDRLPAQSREFTHSSWIDNKTFTNLSVAQVEVLTKNKVPLHGVSCEREGKHRCPTCNAYTINLIIDYRCGTMTCNSRVIKYKIYHTEETKTHPLYDSYINRFNEDVERRLKRAKEIPRVAKSKKKTNK